MKIETPSGNGAIIIGKRVPLGAAINGVAVIFAAIFPDHAVAIMATAIPITFVAQVLIARYGGVTT